MLGSMSTLLRSATQAQVDESGAHASETRGRRVRYLSDPTNLSEKKNGTIVSRMEHSVDQANPVVVRNTNFHPAGDARLGGALTRASPYATIHARALQNERSAHGGVSRILLRLPCVTRGRRLRTAAAGIGRAQFAATCCKQRPCQDSQTCPKPRF